MDSRNWNAWVNLMPPKPDDFHITGEVFASNPGVQAILTPAEPQGINPAILLMNLSLVQQSGMWPQVMTWIGARYDKVLPPNAVQSTQVQILSNGNPIALLDVDVVH